MIPLDDSLIELVLNTLPSEHSRRAYRRGIRDFLKYCRAQPNPVLNKAFLQSYIKHLQSQGVGTSSINQRLAAIRRLAEEATDNGLWPDEISVAFSKVKSLPQRGKRTGTWLSQSQAQRLINAPNTRRLKGKRDQAILSVFTGCGLRCHEVALLTRSHIQFRDGRWVFSDLLGKRRKLRTVPIPDWTLAAINNWLEASGIQEGRLFRAMNKGGAITEDAINHYTLADVVREYGREIGLEIAPHDLRRTFAKLAYKNGAKLDQIQLSLGHASLTTTQVYLGTEQDLQNAPGDKLGLSIESQPDPATEDSHSHSNSPKPAAPYPKTPPFI